MGIFKDKIDIITGGASGIGRALGEELSRRGALVILVDMNTKLLEEVANSITEAGGRAKAATLDVSDYEVVKKLVDDTMTQYGRLDYIFNNAGIGVAGEARDYSYEDWRKVIDVNLYGVVNGVAAAYPIMVKQDFGHIINTASLAGLLPSAGVISYVASKYAIVGLSNALRVEGADLGVKVSVVCPGLIRTPILNTTKFVKIDREKSLKMAPEAISITPEKCARIILRGVERNKATIVVTLTAKLSWLIQRISPGLVLWMGRQSVKIMRKVVRVDD
ncbi:MAG: SDR family NAD(P)-dependent oxidoreductase [Deltaproteobacteria bacterium]|nr:MAG: SDR family NAD(P)-dependent oxidoreductase [Deltaproteobacteria bacterium]